MEIQNDFKIYLDKLIMIPLRKYQKSNWIIQEQISANSQYFTLEIHNYSYEQLYSLGSSVAVHSFNWNHQIQERINARYGIDILGNKSPYGRFSGTDDELNIVNEADKSKLIPFPHNFFDEFLHNVRKANFNSCIAILLKGEIHFEVMLNYEDSVSGLDRRYNNLFNTFFVVNGVYLDNTMYFGKISASKVSLLDIFCLGYLISYTDLKRNHETLKKNQLANKNQ